MELQELKYFLLVMECGNFSKAADKGFTTQPNISKNIASLEASIGSPLFERHRSGVVPTATAIALEKRLRLLMVQFDNLLPNEDIPVETSADTLSIGFAENIDLNTVAAGFFRALKGTTEISGIKLRLKSMPVDEIISELVGGQIDLGFVYSVYKRDNTLFNCIAMTRDKPWLYYSLKHDLAAKEDLKLEDFHDATFVACSFNPNQEYVRFNGLPFVPKNVIQTPSLADISLYVNSGIAVTVLGPSQMIGSSPDIRHITLENASAKIGTDAIWLCESKNDLLKYVIPCLLQK